jgi:Ni,Fe-hydrogenase I small subunit
MDDEDLGAPTRVVLVLLAVVVIAVGQVAALGGVWAAWTGGAFWFWDFSGTEPSGAMAVLILIIGEPVIMGVAYLAFMVLATLVSIPATLKRRRRD